MLKTELAFEALREGDFYRRLAQCRGLALVMFSGPACGTCRSVIICLPEIAAAAGVAQLFLVDVETCSGIAREFEVFHLPTLVLFRDGVFHAQIDSEISSPAFRNAIEQALAGPAQEAP